MHNAAYIRRAVRHDHEAVAARLRGVPGLDQLAGRRERQHFGITEVDHDDVALRVEGCAIGNVERRPLHESRHLTIRCDLPDLPGIGVRVWHTRLTRLCGVKGAVLLDRDVIDPVCAFDSNVTDGFSRLHTELADHG